MSDAVDDALDYKGEAKLRALAEARVRARDDFLTFCKLMMSHPDDPYDPDKTLFKEAPHHKVICQMLEKVETGEWPRMIVTLPPRHGKTQLCAKFFIPWCIGRDPYRHTAYATYNDQFAGDVGRDTMAVMESPEFCGVFPEFEFRKGSKSAGRFQSSKGGTSVVVGRGSALTGRGFHIGVGDDLLKDGAEANSQTIRDRCWDWFTKVFMTRQMEAGAIVILMMTRWHEDDVIGRLTNPENPFYDKEEARNWKVLNLPALAEQNDPLGRKPGEALWPERFPVKFLEGQKRLNPRAFQSLYQQNPAPEEGILFRREWFVFYRARECPPTDQLRIYAVSDHAVATASRNDKTVMLIAGVDNAGTIWLLDCWWGQANALVQVDQMVDLMLKWKPQYWWGEDDTIQLTIGPLLRKRKAERGASCVVITERFKGDKEEKAASVQGLLADKRFRFPKDLWWGFQGMEQMLKFPTAANDDFVDTMSILGMKINELIASTYRQKAPGPSRGTWAWMKKEMAHQERARATLSTAREDGW